MDSTSERSSRYMSKLPNPKWLPVVAIVLAVWAIALGLWWSQLQKAPAPAHIAPVSRPTTVAVTSPKPGATLVPTPEGRPATIPVVREARQLVRNQDWVGMARAFDEAQALTYIAELSSAKYAGRAAGSSGGKQAAEWIAARFAEYGLQPAGDNGTYFQEFPVPYAELTAMPSFELVDDTGTSLRQYRFRDDYTVLLGGYADGGHAEGPVLWVSDGAHDDYDNMDAQGSIVLCRFKLPLEDTLRQAMEHGAKAVLLVPADQPNFRLRRLAHEDALLPQGIPALIIGYRVVEDLLASSGMTFDDLTIQYKAIPLAARVRLDLPLQYQQQATGRNVLGMLPGSDRDGINQVIILGAHYDHLGADPDGTVWVGANDDASGVAVLLEIARQWQEQGYVPRRTVLFAAWDGEEIGLYGSRYYVEHPRYPLRDTEGMLQLDMVGAGTAELLIDTGGLVADQSMVCAAQLNIPVQGQSMGRSDHAPFVGVGVPATLYIWWDGQAPGVIYHVPEDNLENIEPAKLKAAGELTDLVLLSMSWEQEEIETIAMQREQAIATRDVAALLQTVDPTDATLRHHEETWFSTLIARQPAEFTVTIGSAIVAADIATSTVNLRYRWQSDQAQAMASFPARWVRRGLDWYYGGPAWDEVKGRHTRVLHLQQPAAAQALAREADALYEFLTDKAGLDMPDMITVRFYGQSGQAGNLEVSGTGAEYLLHGLESQPTGYDKASGWPVADGIVLSEAADLYTTLLDFALQRSGWPTRTASWLAQGLSDHWHATDSQSVSKLKHKYTPLLLQADVEDALWTVEDMPDRYGVDQKKRELWAAQAWAMTHYLLQMHGWASLQQPLLAADVEAWRPALLAPWLAAADGIQQTLSERSKAVLSGDKAAFLATVDAANPALYQEEMHWFEDLQSHPVKSFAYESQLLSSEGDQAVVHMTLTYRLAESSSSPAKFSYQARFVQREGRWLYADVDFREERSEHFLLKYMTEQQGKQAQELLAQAERAYVLVTDDLDYRPTQPVEIKLYDQDTLFRASIFLSMPPAQGWTELGESIKLSTTDWASVGRLIAHELTHQALFAIGVQHDAILEGTAQYEAGRYDPQWLNSQLRKWRQQLYDLVRSKRPIALTTFSDWREWQRQEPGLIYSMAWDTVTYFRQRYGRDTFLKWLKLLGSGAAFEDAFAKATGMSFADFDAAWRESVLRGHIDPEYIATARAFDGAQALEHVRTLAQPAWAGREAGTLGNKAAAQYIAERFAEYGLQPAGDNSTYFQQFTISRTALITTPMLTLLNTEGQPQQSLRYRVDFRELIGGQAGGGYAQSSIVYVNDFQLDDLRLGGRVLLAQASNDPLQQAQVAQSHGASALLLMTSKWAKDMAIKTNDMPLLDAQTIPVYELTKEASDLLLKLAGYEVWQLRNQPPALLLPLSAHVDVQIEIITPTVDVCNVLGVLPGSDPQLASEVLILGAHLDHVGSLPDSTIYPGANNDASGIAVLLEVARLWHERCYRPRRTVLFAAWNAGEMAQLGSKYYVMHPAYPLDKTLAMIQLDMVGQGRGYYIAVSADKKQEAAILAHLDNVARQVESRLAFGNYEGGSDHDSFHTYGVPAAMLSWERPEYMHLPEDSADAIDVNKLQATGRVATLTLMTMADE